MSKRTILTRAQAPRARLGLVALALALVLGLMGGGIALTHQQSKNRILGNFDTRAAGSAGFVSTYVAQQGARQTLSAQRFLAGRPGPSTEFESIVTSFGSKNAGLLDSSGRLLDLIPLKPAAIGTMAAARLPQVVEAESGRIGVSGVFPSVARGASIISIAAPFPTPGGRRVIGIGYPVAGSVMAIFVEHATAEKGHVVFLIDAKDNVIAASPRTAATTLQAGSPAVAKASTHATRGEAKIHGRSYRFAVAPVAGAPWRLVVAAPDDVLFASINGWARWLPWIVFAVIAMLALVVLALFSRTLAARTEALESSRLKSEFVASMSHEIRTPLNGIVGMTQLLGDTSLDQVQKEYLDALEVSGEALLGVINDVLDFSKIEAGYLKLDRTDFDLRGAVERACQMLAEQAHAKGIEINHWVDAETPVTVNGDRARLRQVLLNLLSNAVKFTASGEVTVRVTSAAGNRVHFAVSDTGVGIDPVQASALFDAFAQADQSTTRQYGGTGLGLAISRQLVELMGGQIGAEAREGGGSLFWFSAELPEGDRVAEPVVARQDLRGLRTLVVDDNASNRTIAFAGTAPRATPPPSKKGEPGDRGLLVLIAEDNAINCTVIEALLGKLGLQTAVAHNGREAIEMAAGHDYDAIFMDCLMPEADGFEATREIRRAENGRHVPIIAMTALSMPGDRERCLAAGMDDYLSKPIRRVALDTAVYRWLHTDPPQEAAND